MIKTGTYSDKAKFEAEGNICNVVSAPSVVAEDVYSSAFAVIDSNDATVNNRAIRLIYALNKNVEIRNILQYGIEHTNYTIENGAVVRKDGNDSYVMNPYYTGNIFLLMYSDELAWNEAAMQNGVNQNKDVIYITDQTEAPKAN